MNKFGILCVVATLLSACSTSYTSNGEKLYLQSRNGVLVDVPAPLTAENISHFYDLPSQPQDAHVSIEPPT